MSIRPANGMSSARALPQKVHAHPTGKALPGVERRAQVADLVRRQCAIDAGKDRVMLVAAFCQCAAQYAEHLQQHLVLTVEQGLPVAFENQLRPHPPPSPPLISIHDSAMST